MTSILLAIFHPNILFILQSANHTPNPQNALLFHPLHSHNLPSRSPYRLLLSFAHRPADPDNAKHALLRVR